MIQKLFFTLFAKPFMALFFGLRIYGRENIPAEHPYVIVANHSSHLDTFSLLSLFPIKDLAKVQPVAAYDYFGRNKIISWVTRKLFNVLLIHRRNITKENHPIIDMKNALDNNRSLIIFPAGTRGQPNQIGKFRSGITYLLREVPDIKIIPIYLKNIGRCLPKGEFLPVPFFCEIHIGEPLQPKGDRKDILNNLETAIKGLQQKT